MSSNKQICPAGVAGVMAAILTGCMSIPRVETPEPTVANGRTDVCLFENVTPERVLDAAERILRRYYEPGGSGFTGITYRDADFDRRDDTLTVEIRGYMFILLYEKDFGKKWVIRVRAEGDNTTAVAAYREEASAGMYPGMGGSSGYPAKRHKGLFGFETRGILIDYRCFWAHLENDLYHGEWAGCPGEGRSLRSMDLHDDRDWLYEPLNGTFEYVDKSVE